MLMTFLHTYINSKKKTTAKTIPFHDPHPRFRPDTLEPCSYQAGTTGRSPTIATRATSILDWLLHHSAEGQCKRAEGQPKMMTENCERISQT